MDYDSINETARATGKVADVAKVGVEETSRLGRFIAPFVMKPLKQVSGIIEDKLKFRRWENQVSFMLKASQKLKEYGLERPNRVIPLKTALPILEYSSLEDENYLQNTWANLLVNAGVEESDTYINLAFVEVLKGLSSLEVTILDRIYSLDLEDFHRRVATLDLPDFASEYIDPEIKDKDENAISEEVQIALSNLDRLGCISITRSLGGGLIFSSVNQTVFGKNFHRACTNNSKKDK